MTASFSYRHLRYFWHVAKEGGFTPAAARLGIAVQTISAQVRELERDLGHELLKPAGRRVVLTEAGAAVLRHADQIFALGEQLQDVVRGATSVPRLRLTIGISDGVSKLAVHHVLQPLMGQANLHLLCQEDEFDDLLGDLALHRLDVVLADQSAPTNPNLRVYTRPLGTSELAWYAPEALVAMAKRDFPRSLSHAPVLLPTSHAAVRVRLDRWFEREGIPPNVVGEFEDSALLVTFGAAGMGVLPAPTLSHRDLMRRGLKRIGSCTGVVEEYFLICTERKVVHPLVQRLLNAHG